MRDRPLTLAVVVAGVVCCGSTALLGGLAGGVALGALGRVTVVTAAGLALVVGVADRLERRRHGRACLDERAGGPGSSPDDT